MTSFFLLMLVVLVAAGELIVGRSMIMIVGGKYWVEELD